MGARRECCSDASPLMKGEYKGGIVVKTVKSEEVSEKDVLPVKFLDIFQELFGGEVKIFH